MVFDEGKLYRARDARGPLGLSENAFAMWAWRVSLPRVEFSKRSIRFRGEDLNKAIERSRAAST